MKSLCTSGFSLNGSSVTADFISGCADGLKDLSCNGVTSDIAACKAPPGTLAAGTGCISDEQCSTSYCKRTGDTCGVCTVPTPIGGDCSTGIKCVDGASCARGECVAEVNSALGGPCDLAKSQTCQRGLYCEYTTKTCKAYVALGGACSAGAPCTSDLQCDETSNTCVKPTLLAEGQACGATTRCAVDLVCDPMSLKCTKLTVVPPGGDCSGKLAYCEQGSCVEATGKCPTIIADGGACTAGDDSKVCAFGAQCVTGKCLLPSQIVCK